MGHIDNNAPALPAIAREPGTGTPGADYVWTEEDRRAVVELTVTVEFLMTAASAIARGFPLAHPEVAQYLNLARLKMPGGAGGTPVAEV